MNPITSVQFHCFSFGENICSELRLGSSYDLLNSYLQPWPFFFFFMLSLFLLLATFAFPVCFVVYMIYCCHLLGLPPNVNSMQVPPSAPRGMSSAQVFMKLIFM